MVDTMTQKNQAHSLKIGFMAKPNLKEKLEEFSRNQGVPTSVICRKALVHYLKLNKYIRDEVEYL